MSRFVRPEFTTIKISQGDTLTVTRRLNAGEERELFSRMYIAGVDGQLKANPFQTGLAMVLAYLLDWSLTDDEGKLVVIRDRGPEVLTSALNGLAPEDFAEVRTAIEQHDQASRVAREQEKKDRDGEKNASAISPSPSGSAGESSGSAN